MSTAIEAMAIERIRWFTQLEKCDFPVRFVTVYPRVPIERYWFNGTIGIINGIVAMSPVPSSDLFGTSSNVLQNAN